MAATATTTMMIRTVFAGTRMSPCGGRPYSCGLRYLLELRLRIAPGDLRRVDEHDRVPDMELLHRPVDGGVAERGPAEELPDPAVTGDSGALGVVFVARDDDALDVGE